MRQRMWVWIGVLSVAGASAQTAGAAVGPYSALVVFGDSLSDVGNDAVVTANLPPAFGVSPTPGPYYYQGRFSNGPNYVDDLAAKLGLAAPVPSVLGGTDYAYGDAQTAGSPAAQRTIIHDVDQQLSDYLKGNTPSPTALYDVYAGNNDVFTALTEPTPAAAAAYVTAAAGNVAADVDALFKAGGRHFLVPNLPLLGETPAANGSAATSVPANQLSLLFNTDLAIDLAKLQITDAGIDLHTLDVGGLLTAVQANPGAFGFKDATDSAAPGLLPGATSYNTALEVSDPQDYLFWDDVHPTAAGHTLLANAAYAAVVPEPASLSAVAALALLVGRRRRSRSR